MTMNDVKGVIKKITDSRSLSCFLKMLSEDFEQKPGDWECCGVDGYLRSISSWVEDGGLEKVLENEVENQYQAIAITMYLGKIYE
jgi:hypothetical protein